MPHQCVHCGELYPDAAPELLKGCKCGSKFFYYVKQERIEQINKEVQETIFELGNADKVRIEKDIREITGMDEEPEKPVVLDIESVRVISPGKFEIDIINLFSKKRPVIYRLEEGKYVIDLSSSIKVNRAEIEKKIKDPRLTMGVGEDEKAENEDDVEEEIDEEPEEED